MDELRSILSTNQSDRLKKEKAALDHIDDPKLPRHTVYQGDRKIQQLGQDTIENGIVLNNQSVAIGDVMLPLAKGNVLRRVDSTNGGALLGTAYRDAIENDYDANGNRRNSALSRNGGNEPSDPSNPNNNSPIDKNTHPIFPPPFGCTPPPPKCFWTTNPIPPNGFQSHGSAVVNENAVPLYLHCTAGSSVAKHLNCAFLDKWSCSGGVCSPDANGTYNSQSECEAALVWTWQAVSSGLYSGAAPGFCATPAVVNAVTASGTISNAQYPVAAVIDNSARPSPPGCPGKNHYKFVDALGNELAYVGISSDSYTVNHSRACP